MESFCNYNSRNIDISFRQQVSSIKSFLIDAKKYFDEIDILSEKSSMNLSYKIILERFSSMLKTINNLSYDFHELASKIPKSEEDNYKMFVQDMLHPYFMSSPFPYRCYNKPLGYAGDYEMMNMIQRENAEGPNLFSKFVNAFYTNIPIANSVKNRTDNLVRLIKEGVKKSEELNREYSSLSIGCGPALEIKKFLENNSPKVKCNFKLLDFNEETLNFAVTQANSFKSENVNIIGELNSVHELLKRSISDKLEEEKYDFVYCSGLFDYLSDKICSKLIKLFYSMVKPGGKVFVTNMHSNNHDHRMMELLLEWYLIYRDEKNMANLVPGLGEQKLYTDKTGVNLCLEINKSANTYNIA